ncbi:MAG: FAD-dependent monooxygenase [Sciscionella sp.]
MRNSETEVIVVGAGPVGLLLAGELRLGGVDVVVVERLSEPTGESRASQLNSRTMEVLDQRGLLDRLGETHRESGGHFGGIPLDVSEVPSVHAGYWKIPQHRTEGALQAWSAGLGADIRREHELRELATHPDHVEAVIGTSGGSRRLRAEYLVGCDGERSTVRRLAGFDFAGTEVTRELFRADVSGIDIPARRFERREHGLAISGKRDGVTRVMFHEFGRKAGHRTGPPDFAEVVAGWEKITGEDIGSGTPIWTDVFCDASKQAARYREDRVLLAGDAAHVQLPAGGQALNLGLQDAMNLGWKLAAQVRGWAPAGLLDSYHDERHPVGRWIRANVAAQGQLLLGGREMEAVRAVFGELLALRQARDHLALTLSGLDVRYPVGQGGHPLLGARLPPQRLRTANGPSSTTALMRGARGLLLGLSGRAADQDAIRAVATKWTDRVDVVAATAHPDDPLSEVDAVLVRPDGHVAWIDSDTAELEIALYRWFGEPAWRPETREGVRQWAN